MAEINLGNFPYYGGIQIDDKSIYLGNNRFVRIATQRDNDATIGVVYESTNVFDANATVSQVCSEVILKNTSIANFEMCQMGNGNIFLIGSTYGQNGNYILVISYDDVNNTFNVIYNETVPSTVPALDSYDSLTITPYDNTKVIVNATDTGPDRYGVVLVDTNGVLSYENIIDYYSPALMYSNNPSSYNHISNLVDDIHYFVFSRELSGYQSVVDLSTNTAITIASNNIYNIDKLTDGKYIALLENRYSNDITYNIVTKQRNPLPSDFTNFSHHSPQINFANSNHEDTRRATIAFALDEFHYMVFHTPSYENAGGRGKLYAKVVNVLDNDYAFVSDNSTGEVLVTSSLNPNHLDDNNGKLVNRLDTTKFYFKSGNNSFEFFEISV